MSLFHRLLRKDKPTLERVQPGSYPFLVTGCARSGTHFISKFLQLNGLDLGHESTGTLGSVTWLLAAPAMRAEKGVTFEKTAHIIRDPRKSLQSLYTMSSGSWKRIYRYAPECQHRDTVVAAARYWLRWNQLSLRAASLSVRLEDFEADPKAVLSSLSEFFGRPLDPALIFAAREHGDSRAERENYGRHVDLAHVQKADPSTYEEIKSFGSQFGYTVE